VFGGIHHGAKFGWNRCNSFDNTQVLIFNVFGLKRAIHAPNGGCLEDFVPKWEQSHGDPHEAPTCAAARHRSYRSLTSVHHGFLRSSAFYPVPRNPMIYNGLDTPRSDPFRWTTSTSMVNWVDSTQHLIRHLDRFSRYCRAQNCDRQTDAQTDHATRSVTVIQPENI